MRCIGWLPVMEIADREEFRCGALRAVAQTLV